MSRVVVWFSCGAASAVAAKLAVKKYGHERIHIVYCNTLASEHPDNQRFMGDVSAWLNHPIEIISSQPAYSELSSTFHFCGHCFDVLKSTEFEPGKPMYIYGVVPGEEAVESQFQEAEEVA